MLGRGLPCHRSASVGRQCQSAAAQRHAYCSSVLRLVCRPQPAAGHPSRILSSRRKQQQQQQQRNVRVHVQPPDVDDFEEESIEIDDEDQTPFDEIINPLNKNPDFADEEWASKVDDWSEFWYDTELDDDDFDDEHDAGQTNFDKLQRAEQMIEAIQNIDKRSGVINILGPPMQGKYHEEPELQNLPFELDERNPDWSAFDFRAMVEKRRKKEMLDKEWRRQQSLVGRFNGLTIETDVRVQREEDDWIREEWTHEQILDLIVGGGAYVDPSLVQAEILNPLAVADYHAMGVRHIPETEEAIAAMGHLADDSVLLQLEQGVELGQEDFVDPTLMFGDEEGTIYMSAPVNEWQQLQRLQMADAVEELTEMINEDRNEAPYPYEGDQRWEQEADAHNEPMVYYDLGELDDDDE